MNFLVKTTYMNLRFWLIIWITGKIDVTNLEYCNFSENVICSKVRSLEEIVDTIRENNVDDKVKDNIVHLELVTHNEILIASGVLHNF